MLLFFLGSLNFIIEGTLVMESRLVKCSAALCIHNDLNGCCSKGDIRIDFGGTCVKFFSSEQNELIRIQKELEFLEEFISKPMRIYNSYPFLVIRLHLHKLKGKVQTYVSWP